MAINFPTSPSVDDTHVVGDVTWRWDGTAWRSNSTFNGRMPAGTVAQRPSEPVIGQIRYNTDDDVFEGYDAAGWRPFYGTFPDTPTGTAIANTEPDTTFTLQADSFTHILGIEHESSDWQVSLDPAFGNTVVESLNDTTNLTSYEVTGGISTQDTFYWRVRYRDQSGAVSDWSTPVEFDILVPPPELGDSYCGGIYMGDICAAGSCYRLIVAPNATGCAQCLWKTTATATSGTGSLVDGYNNTYGPMDNADHPAGNWCATRTINGFSDWYLPAISELGTVYDNGGGTGSEFVIGSGEAFGIRYWSSTETNACCACYLYFYFQGYRLSAVKNRDSFIPAVRAFRREPI